MNTKSIQNKWHSTNESLDTTSINTPVDKFLLLNIPYINVRSKEYNIDKDMLFRLGMLNTRRVQSNIQLNDIPSDEIPIYTHAQIFKHLK